MHDARVIIVGAGLSGLYAAYLLERAGIRDYILLEARNMPGGRITSVSPNQMAATSLFNRFDLGAAWFWPEYQYELHHLIQELNLKTFEQFESGDMIVEYAFNTLPVRMPGYKSVPASMRLLGGMTALTDALYRHLDPSRIHTGQAVRSLRCMNSHIQLDSEGDDGHCTTWQAEHILLAVPPRLAEMHITFEPALPATLARQWRETPTWMAPHAKYVAIYDTPFWRNQGLSGEARSTCGPLGEIHDASVPGGKAALFGFLSIPMKRRRQLADSVLRQDCRTQLIRLFGLPASTPCAEFIKDWAQDSYTATMIDLDATGHHAAMVEFGPWQGRLIGIASEWSLTFPGYMAGAIETAGAAIQALLSHFASESEPEPEKRLA